MGRKFSLRVVVGAAAAACAAGAVLAVVSLLCAHRPCVNSVKSWSLSSSPLSPPAVGRSVSQSVSPSLSPLEAFVLFFVLSHRKRMHLFYVPRIYAATGILEDTFHAALGKFFPI